MSFDRKTLRRLILEEVERISELEEFGGAPSGQKFMKEGVNIQKSAKKIFELANDQTGSAKKTIKMIGEFVHKLGGGIASINDLSEGSCTSRMPEVKEYNMMIKEIKKLEK